MRPFAAEVRVCRLGQRQGDGPRAAVRIATLPVDPGGCIIPDRKAGQSASAGCGGRRECRQVTLLGLPISREEEASEALRC